MWQPIRRGPVFGSTSGLRVTGPEKLNLSITALCQLSSYSNRAQLRIWSRCASLDPWDSIRLRSLFGLKSFSISRLMTMKPLRSELLEISTNSSAQNSLFPIAISHQLC